MNSGSGNSGGVFGALLFTIGILVLFAIAFGLFLIVPFFFFLAGIIAMIFSDRKRDRREEDVDAEQERKDQDAQDAVERENARQRALI